MMYCGNCAETADESKTKSRQIACERVNTLKNAVKRLGSWNTVKRGVEQVRGKGFPGNKNISKISREEPAQMHE